MKKVFGLLLLSALLLFSGCAAEEDAAIGSVSLLVHFEEDIFIDEAEFALLEGDTALSVLQRAAQELDMSVVLSGTGEFAYVGSIDQLEEKAHGPYSGWLYEVGAEQPQVGAGSYTLEDGDEIVWYYSVDMMAEFEAE